MTAIMAMALVVAGPPPVLAVRLVALEGRPALRILTAPTTSDPLVSREGDEVRVLLAAEAGEDLELPAPSPPLVALFGEREPGRYVIHVRVAPEVPFEVRRDGALLTVVFGEQTAFEAHPGVEELYDRLFPRGLGVEPARPASDTAVAGDEAGGGVRLGPVRLRPKMRVSFLDADTAAGNPPRVLRDQYLQVQPGLTAETMVLAGRIEASYEPRLRFFSSVPEVRSTTQGLNTSLNLPVGPRLRLGVSEHFMKGVLEATEVDPGREYFANLGEFRRSDTQTTARVEIGPRVGLDLGAGFSQIRVAQDAAFFSYDETNARAGIGYELSTNLRAVLSYVYGHIPQPADRPQAGSTAHGISLGLTGELAPLTSGRAEVAVTSQTNPLAGSGGQRYRGLVATVGLRRELGHESTLEVSVRRSVDPSDFEDNGFYVATMTEAAFTTPGPYSVHLNAGGGYQWSDYSTTSVSLGEPRADRILAWFAGLSRSFGERFSVRADYRSEKRFSNLPGFTITTHAFVVDVTVGFFGGGEARP